MQKHLSADTGLCVYTHTHTHEMHLIPVSPSRHLAGRTMQPCNNLSWNFKIASFPSKPTPLGPPPAVAAAMPQMNIRAWQPNPSCAQPHIDLEPASTLPRCALDKVNKAQHIGKYRNMVQAVAKNYTMKSTLTVFCKNVLDNLPENHAKITLDESHQNRKENSTILTTSAQGSAIM